MKLPSLKAAAVFAVGVVASIVVYRKLAERFPQLLPQI